MAQRIPNFDGFTEPTENYTKLPNEFFDKVLVELKPPEAKALLFIIRQTWGWQRMFAQIAVSQFMKRLRMSKNTVLKVLDSLEDCRCILHYRTGSGSARKTFFFVRTPTTYRVVQALREGHITIAQAEILQQGYPHHGARLAPNMDSKLGATSEPNLGAAPAPSLPTAVGAKIEPNKRTKKIESGKKKGGDPPLQNVEKPSEAETNAVERFREQRLTRNRRAEQSTDSFVSMGELAKHLLNSQAPTETQE